MNETLKYPGKPAHFIIDVRDDGTALRNDGMELQAANANPWYVMATIFGEQLEGATIFDVDLELAGKNRRAWNGWMCAHLDDKERADRAKKVGLTVAELAPLSKEEMNEISDLWGQRTEGAKLPDAHKPLNFSTTYFSKIFYFEKYVVEKDANFVSTTFGGNANFASTTFGGDAYFGSTTFGGDAYFGSTTFVGYAHFVSTTFVGYAHFVSTTFVGYAHFVSTTFGGNAHFVSTTFGGDAYFGSMTFGQQADFSSAIFKGRTDFSEARFSTHVPQFHAATLYDDTVFPVGDNERENWPPVKGTVAVEGREEPVTVMAAAQQKSAYNRLRLFMNKALQTDEEQFFHRMEMRCKRETEGPMYRPIYTAFEVLSDYGNSVLRPAGALVYLWLFGVFVRTQPMAG